MNDLDRKIQAALHRSQTSDTTTAGPSLAEEVLVAFRGRYRWLSGLMVVLNIAFFAGFVWAAVRFTHAEEIAAQMRWGGLALVLLLFVMSVKIWFWLELHSNRVLRELKRLELLLVSRGSGAERA